MAPPPERFTILPYPRLRHSGTFGHRVAPTADGTAIIEIPVHGQNDKRERKEQERRIHRIYQKQHRKQKRHGGA